MTQHCRSEESRSLRLDAVVRSSLSEHFRFVTYLHYLPDEKMY